MKRILCVFLAAAALAGCSRQETMAELTDRVFGRAAVQFLCLDAASPQIHWEVDSPASVQVAVFFVSVYLCSPSGFSVMV